MKVKRTEYNLFYGATPNIFDKAKALRSHQTKAEKTLWEYLKAKKILGLKFRRQHPINQFIADFYCHQIKLVIELDGPVHNEKEQKEYDDGRTFKLENFGIKVIRFSNSEIENNIDEVTKEIKRICQELID